MARRTRRLASRTRSRRSTTRRSTVRRSSVRAAPRRSVRRASPRRGTANKRAHIVIEFAGQGPAREGEAVGIGQKVARSPRVKPIL